MQWYAVKESAVNGQMKKRLQEENGALVVEATIVFPVCLIIILVLLYLGNVYYQKSRIESIVVQAVLDGAAYSADPMLKKIEDSENHAVPAIGEVDFQPYRYIGGMFGGMEEIENSVRALIINRISGLNTGLFTGMKPSGYQTGNSLVVRYNGSFIASSVSVDLEYKIDLPIRLLGDSERLSMKFKTHTEVPVSDSPEFIRNVDLVEDLLEVTGLKEDITKKVKELKDFFSQLFH